MTDGVDFKFCCERMRDQVNRTCELHDNAFDCPDRLVWFSEEKRIFGLIIHDGGSSYITIVYCPWCGSKLPTEDESL